MASGYWLYQLLVVFTHSLSIHFPFSSTLSLSSAFVHYIYHISPFLHSQLTRDERSDNEEEEEEETEDEGEEQHKLGNGLAVDEKEDKNGCFGCLSPPENICRSKTVY